MGAREDRLVVSPPFAEIAGDWRGFLDIGIGADDAAVLLPHERTGRLLGIKYFMTSAGMRAGRSIAYVVTRT